MSTRNRYFNYFKGMFILSLSILLFSSSLVASAEEYNSNQKVSEPESLVYKFVNAVNDNDIESYISLFTSDNQIEMQGYITQNSDINFFKENKIEIKNLKKLSNKVGKESANISDEDYAKYSDIIVYYAEEVIDAENYSDIETMDNISDGYSYKDFVIVKENNQWKILRVSTANISKIEKENEGFGSSNEKDKLEEQKDEISIIPTSILPTDDNNLDSLSIRTVNSLSAPSTITVYFTKSANSSYYGTSHKSIAWSTYLKNVVPNEWTVSYYGNYPAYLLAGTTASKMYAWYYTVYPKWDYAPYYSDVKDNSEDQNFLYNAYSSLATTYKSYVDTVYSLLSSVAMVTSSGNNLFEVHYHATSGSYHSGQLSASGCLSKAQSGYSYSEILHYYYDSSTYTNNDTVTLVTY